MAYPGAPYEDAIVGVFKVGRAIVGKIWLLEEGWLFPARPTLPLDLHESVCTEVGLAAAARGEVVLVPSQAIEVAAVATATVEVGLAAVARGELVLVPVSRIATGLLARACTEAELVAAASSQYVLAGAGRLEVGLAPSAPVAIVLEAKEPV